MSGGWGSSWGPGRDDRDKPPEKKAKGARKDREGLKTSATELDRLQRGASLLGPDKRLWFWAGAFEALRSADVLDDGHTADLLAAVKVEFKAAHKADESAHRPRRPT